MSFIKNLNAHKVIFILILSFAAFIRFYRLPEMASFDYDQESASNIVYSIVKYDPVRLVGQELSFQGMFMGPFYYYFLTPFYYLTNLHPIGGFIGSIVISFAILAGYYLLARQLFGRNAALLALFLRSILHEELLHDWSMIPSYACELVVLATWFCFYKIWNKQKVKIFLPLLTFLFGLYTSIYPVLFPFFFVFIYLVVSKRIKPERYTLLLSIITFLVPLSPLIIFEFRYNFLQTQRLLGILSSPKETPGITHFFYYIKYNLLEIDRILNLRAIPKILSLSLFFFTLVFLIKKKIGFWKEEFHKRMLIASYAIFIVSFTFLPTHVSDNYFIALSTLSLLYIAGMLALLVKNKIFKIVLVLLLLNIAVFNLKLLKNRWDNPSLTTLAYKESIVREILRVQADKGEFYVSYISLPGWTYGFDYLFKYYGKEPLKGQPQEPIYTIVVPRFLVYDSLDITFGNIGLIYPEEVTKGKHPFKVN